MSYARQAVEHIEIQVETSLDTAVTEFMDFVSQGFDVTDDDAVRTFDNLLDQYYLARRAEEVWQEMKAIYHEDQVRN